MGVYVKVEGHFLPQVGENFHFSLASFGIVSFKAPRKMELWEIQEGNLYFLENYFVILWKIIVIVLFL